MRSRRGGAVPAGLIIAAGAIATAAVLLSCEGKPTAPGHQHTYSLTARAQPPASAEVGGGVSPDPTVLALMDGQPVSGIRVVWTPADGGSVSPTSSTTDANGLAFTSWTLGTTAGGQHLTASALSLATVSFSTTATAGPLARITLAQHAVTLSDLGDTLTLRAGAVDRFGNALATPAVTWTSLSGSVVSVSPAGLLRGLAMGTARVVVASGSLADTATVEVRRPAGSVAVTPRALSFGALTATAPLAATVTDRRGEVIAGAAVTWQSADTSVASVSAAGVVMARRNGQTTVFARADNLRDSASVVVQQVAARVAVVPSSATMTAGDTLRLSGQVVDSLGSPMSATPVTWSSADTMVVTVSAGRLTARKVGRTEVVAASGALKTRVAITVTPGDPITLTVSPATATMQVGREVTLTASASDAQGNDVPVSPTWSSTDASVAAVSGAGVVTGARVGITTVQAAVGALRGMATITVTAPPPPAAVRITQRVDTLNYIGASLQLTAAVLDATGSPLALAPTWVSLNPDRLSVTPTGLATSRAGGYDYGRVVARYGELTDSGWVLTRQVARSIVPSPTSLTINVGDTAALALAIVDSGGTAVPDAAHFVIFSPPNQYSPFVRVEPAGVGSVLRVIGLSTGVVTVSLADPQQTNFLAEVPVTVVARNAGLRVTPSEVHLDPDHPTAQLDAVRLDAYGNPMACAALTYTADDGGALLIFLSATGLITGRRGPGSTLVYVTCGSLRVSVPVTLTAGRGSITLSPPSVRVAVGDSVFVTVSSRDYSGNVAHYTGLAMEAGQGFAVNYIDNDGFWVRGVAPGSWGLLATSFADAFLGITVVPTGSAGARMPDMPMGGRSVLRLDNPISPPLTSPP